MILKVDFKRKFLFHIILLYCVVSVALCVNTGIIFGKTSAFSPSLNQEIFVPFEQNLPFSEPVVFASVEASPLALTGGSQVPIKVLVQSVTLTGVTFKITSNLSINSASDIKIHYIILNRDDGGDR